MLADTTASVIAAIRAEYKHINADSAMLKVIRKDVMDESTEGGEILQYFDGNRLRKAVALFYGETGKSRTEYYFGNGKIIFIYKVVSHYNKPMYMEGSKVDRKDEDRFYFNTDGSLIRWIDKTGRIADIKLYSDRCKELMEELKEVR